MEYNEVLRKLKALSNPKAVSGMARFGIRTVNAYGLSLPHLRAMAKRIGRDHELALQLWSSGIHEARILASMIDDPVRVTDEQMESWVKDFDSWDICDNCCGNLFDKTKFAYRKAIDWSRRPEEFVKRAGFALMAYLAVHDKLAANGTFEQFLPIIKREATDDRNFVRKSVNWALRQIGKRNLKLNRKAIVIAREIQRIDSKAAKWIASDALRELTSQAVRKRLRA